MKILAVKFALKKPSIALIELFYSKMVTGEKMIKLIKYHYALILLQIVKENLLLVSVTVKKDTLVLYVRHVIFKESYGKTSIHRLIYFIAKNAKI